MRFSSALHVALCVATFTLAASPASAQTLIFQDTFDTAPSPLWANEAGAWTVSGGQYYATMPNNNPLSTSSLPFQVGDCDFEMDINGVSDGGVFLHLDDTSMNGILLVTGGHSHSGHGFYWHIVTNGVYSGTLNESPAQFNQGDNIHILVTTRGDTCAVYVNSASTPATTLTVPTATRGRVGLYDFTLSQHFDNVRLSVFCDGDLNRDGNADQDDVDYLVNVVSGGANPTGIDPDFNHDGNVDQGDIDSLINVIAGGECQG